jgi:hypothetical protein
MAAMEESWEESVVRPNASAPPTRPDFHRKDTLAPPRARPRRQTKEGAMRKSVLCPQIYNAATSASSVSSRAGNPLMLTSLCIGDGVP